MENSVRRNLTLSDLAQIREKEVIKLDATKFTASGDKYGSNMFDIDMTLQSIKDAAMMFALDLKGTKLFQSWETMNKEMIVYEMISPEFEKIQEEELILPSERLHVFYNCPESRLSLEDGDQDPLADHNCVFQLENLKVQGYTTGDRVKGFDLNHIEFILKHLAMFHATAVAIKMKKPFVFSYMMLDVLKVNKVSKEMDEKRKAVFLERLKEIPACAKYIDALRRIFNEDTDTIHSGKIRPSRELFATFTHFDFWTKNIMLKYNSANDNNPIDFKIDDFQRSQYGSPVNDIFLFLFTSIEIGLVSQHIDNFLDLYYHTHVEWLQRLGCQTKLFTRKKFLQEIQITASSVLSRIVLILMEMTLNKEQTKEFGGHILEDVMPISFNDFFKKKVSEAIYTYAKKGWI